VGEKGVKGFSACCSSGGVCHAGVLTFFSQQPKPLGFGLDEPISRGTCKKSPSFDVPHLYDTSYWVKKRIFMCAMKFKDEHMI
jgi:hypothetical protein